MQYTSDLWIKPVNFVLDFNAVVKSAAMIKLRLLQKISIFDFVSSEQYPAFYVMHRGWKV